MTDLSTEVSLAKNRKLHLVIFFLLTLIVLSIFSQSLHYPFFSVDDSAYVTQNGDIRRIDGEMIGRWFSNDYVLLYIPVTIASFAIDYQLWHFNPFGYRFTNLLLHLLNTFLVYCLLWRLTQNGLFAFGVSCIFAIHPVQIESVVWISERKNLLSTFFLLSGFWFYLHQKIKTTFVCFLLGIFSKPNIAMLPIILFFHHYFYGSKLTTRQRWLLIAGMVLVAVFCSWMTLRSHHAEKEFFFRGGTFLTNLYVMMDVFFRYIRLLVFPFHQQIFYMNQVHSSFWNPKVMLAAAGILILLTVVIFFTQRKSKMCFWMIWYLVFLLPMSNIFTPIGTLMNDRYLYVPIIGFFAAILISLQKASRNLFFNPTSGWNFILSLVVVGMFSIPFGLLSYSRVQQWKTSAGVLEVDMIQSQYPDVRMYTAKASELISSGDVQGAIASVDKALKISPTPEVMIWQVQNYLEAGLPEKAFELLKVLDQLPKLKRSEILPDFYGLYYGQIGKYTEAETAFREAIARNKRKIVTYKHLTLLYKQVGKLDEALETLQSGLRIDPDSAELLTELCDLYLLKKDYSNAYPIYLRLAKLYPHNAYVEKISRQMKAQSTG